MPSPAFLPPISLPLHARPPPALSRRPPALAPRPTRLALRPSACLPAGAPPAPPPPTPLILPTGDIAGENSPGVFAIFSASGAPQHICISRDVAISLRRCLARCPDESHLFSAHYLPRPSRTAFAALKTSWLDAVGGAVGNDDGEVQKAWESPIDVRAQLNDEEIEEMRDCLPGADKKILRRAANRIEDEIVEGLGERGVTEKLRFAPKIKDTGLLDIESVKIKVPQSIGSSTSIKDTLKME